MLEYLDHILVVLIISLYAGLLSMTLIGIWWERQDKESNFVLRLGWFLVGACFALVGQAPRSFDIPLDGVLNWLILGALVGTLVASRMSMKFEETSLLSLVTMGLTGVLMGLGLYSLIGFDFGLAAYSISLAEILYSVVGAVVFCGLVSFYRTSFPD